ncbi:hypothetical protein Tco_0549234 [Tanacetum coccineum]
MSLWLAVPSDCNPLLKVRKACRQKDGSNDNYPFVAPPSSDTVIKYVNTLGYPSTLRNVSAMSVNALYQPWRAILSMINMCLTSKPAGYDRPTSSVQITWGIIANRSYSISAGKDLGRRYIWHSIPDALITDEIKGAPYYGYYREHVAKYQQFLDAERGKAEEGGETESSDATKVTKPKAVKEQAERTQGPTRPVVLREPDSRKYQPLPEVQGNGKEKVVDEQAAHDLLTLQTPTKKSPVDQFIFQRHPPMPTGHADLPSLDTELALTDSETESDEEVHVINTGDQDKGQAGPNPGEQDEVQAGPNLGIQDEGQARSNPGDAGESQPHPSHGVHAGPNREHMDLEATDASSQQKPEQIDDEFTTTVYPNVQENLKLPTKDHVILEELASSMGTLSSLQNLEKDLSFTDQFFVEKPHKDESGKTNAETKVSQAVDEIVTNAVDWAMQDPLRARFRDLPTVDMKEILQQRMFEDNSYKAHEVHNDLFEGLKKSLE